MASYEQRGNTWRAYVRLRGIRKTATFDTKEEARTWATKKEAEILADARDINGTVGFTPVSTFLLRYAAEVSPSKRGGWWEVLRLQKLSRDRAFHVPMRDFGADSLAKWRDERLKTVRPATVNRELNLLSGVFTRAIREWKIGLKHNPVRDVARPKNPPARKRRVRDTEATAIREKLGWDGAAVPSTPSQWVAWAHALAIETAMRKGEILGLQRARVHEKYVELVDGDEVGVLGQTKNGRGRLVPLSSRARELMAMAMAAGHDPLVPVNVGWFDRLFREAKDAAGLPDLHFHDSRREGTTRIAKKVGNALDLARITGHRDMRQLLDYFAPEADDLADKLG